MSKSKAGVTKLLLPTLLLGAGLGALWSYDREEAQLSAETRADMSLPLQVEDIAPVEQPAASEPHAVTAGAPAWASRAPVQVQKPPFHPHHRHAAAHKPSAHTAPPPPQPQAEAVPPPEPPAAPAPVSHHLAEELRLMRAASAALTENEPAKALRILNDHARRFPDGALAEERRALRAIGLCKQHAPEARRELEAFLRSDPQSPLAARVRDACELPP